jgi:aldose 1-epimerase
VAVTYELRDDATLCIDVEGRTDAPTVLNVTNHAYWNLEGTSSPTAPQDATVREHLLSVAADRVVRVDDALLPTGALDPVQGTVFDLRSATPLGTVIDAGELAPVGGLDHCFVLDGSEPAAELVDPGSGRRLRLVTDQPGLQVYTSNHGAGPLPRHAAVCLESQHLPDAPNQSGFPSAVLRPGATYRHRTQWWFS